MKMPEVNVARKLSHPHIVTLKDVILEERKLHLVFELMDSNVQKMINMKSTDLHVEGRIKLILYDALKGIKALHDHDTFHANLKPSHLFIKEDNGKVLIGGLSDSKNYPKFYRAPEILLGSTMINSKCDIFSLGLIFSHLLINRPLISGVDNKAQLTQMCALFGTPKESNWPEAYDLALEMEYRFPIDYQKATGILVDPVNLSKTMTETTEEAIDLIYKM